MPVSSWTSPAATASTVTTPRVSARPRRRCAGRSQRRPHLGRRGIAHLARSTGPRAPRRVDPRGHRGRTGTSDPRRRRAGAAAAPCPRTVTGRGECKRRVTCVDTVLGRGDVGHVEFDTRRHQRIAIARVGERTAATSGRRPRARRPMSAAPRERLAGCHRQRVRRPPASGRTWSRADEPSRGCRTRSGAPRRDGPRPEPEPPKESPAKSCFHSWWVSSFHSDRVQLRDCQKRYTGHA